MNVFLTFDIEVWCNGWDNLDGNFPASFQRYVYGRSPAGDYALPQTLAILNQWGLKGVFFVEPLFATRFGIKFLEIIVRLIRDAGHEVQLHLHPEWTDEAIEPIIPDCTEKRQHLSYYTLEEQTALIGHGKKLLESVGSGTIAAFRAGSFAANRDTFVALRRNAIRLDSSLNRCYAVSAPDLFAELPFGTDFVVSGVTTFPVTVMKDGFGRPRPAHVNACSFSEMRDALISARQAGARNFVIVSHNFEMLKPLSSTPDWIVVRRFERLCAYLKRNFDSYNVRGFDQDLQIESASRQEFSTPTASTLSTVVRYVEQIRRRVF